MLVLSDIHANLPALQAVIDDAGQHDTVFFCGDLVGYYPWPDHAIETAREEHFLGVRGNHDEALVAESTFGFNSVAAEALRWTEENLSEESRAYLKELPYTRREEVQGADVLVVHGSPAAPVSEYVYPEQVTEQFLERQNVNADVLLLGHTHVPFVKRVGETLVVNPGSVGQPRDGDPRASYAVVNVEEQEADIRRVEYPVDAVREHVRAEGLPSPLADRLSRGR